MSLIHVHILFINQTLFIHGTWYQGSDLLLRQYQRVRKKAAEQKGRTFSYEDIHPVFTIVLIEQSTKAFHEFRDCFFHRFRQCSDTGLELNLLQNYIFIALDIFKAHLHDRGIKTEMDAWLAFLSCDEPQVICNVLEKHPEIFRDLYMQICDLCRNTEEVMTMFSRELAELDRNTTLLMIEELQEELLRNHEVIQQKDEALQQKDEALQQKDEALQQKDEALQQKDEVILQKDEEIEQLRLRLAALGAAASARD